VNTLTKVAEFVQSRDLARMPNDRFDRVKRHVVDSWAAQMAGARIDANNARPEPVALRQAQGDPEAARRVEGRARGSWFDTLTTSGLTQPLPDLVLSCAQARCTEIDDIHLTSCTTPGAVVVSTALALADRRAKMNLRDFCAAVLAGYECMIRLGVAIDGPTALHRGVWPTACTAAFGSAAVAARLMGLSVEETAGALATSIAFAQHRAMASSPPRSSRWLTLGVAAANGVLAARGALAGLSGSIDVDAWSAALLRGLARRFLFDEIGMKPFPTARQALAAIEATRGLVDAERLTPTDITAIIVAVPEPQRFIIDRPGFPQTRFDSIVNVRYQIALAIVAPDRIVDVERTPLFTSPTLRRLMTKIRVTRARDLDGCYPRSWPARVEVRSRGRRHVRTVMHPHGDAKRPLTWSDLRVKTRAIAAPTAKASAIDRVVDEWRDADADAPMPLLP